MALYGKGADWFPGHMKLTKDLLKMWLNRVDLVVNLVDARAPMSSTNFAVLKLIKRKPFVVFLGKSDLADENLTKSWVSYFRSKFGFFSVALSCKHLKQVESSFNLAFDYLQSVKNLKFGSHMVRVMVVGISNVGKSSLINSFSGFKKTKVENRPGVTRSMKWIFLKSGVGLLDTPGVLPVGFKSEEEQFILKLIGSISREKVDVESLLINFLNHLKALKVDFFKQFFSKSLVFCEDVFDWLNDFAKVKGMVLKGGEPDLNRASNFLIDGFRNGKFGRITLEAPNFLI